MLSKRYMIVVKIMIYLSLGLFILFKGEAYFHLSPGVRKLLIAMLFLFAFLRIFEAFQMYRAGIEEERMRL